MQVVFDNIIFRLQRTGGISVVWQELLKRAVADPSFDKVILDYPGENICRMQLDLSGQHVLYPHIKTLERYLSPSYKATGDAIFHSSYFRILQQEGVRNITTVHDLTYHYYRKGLPKRVHLWEELRALKHSAGIICISENTKFDLLNCYPWVDEDKIRVINNGVSNHFYPLEKPAPIVGLEPGGFLLYVGNRSASYKNFPMAVNVAKESQLKLAIVGSPLTDKEQSWLTDELGTDGFLAVGHLQNNELNNFYNQALCLLYPSDYEGFGIPILEAQRAGCPVVCQHVSSIPEVAGNGALLVSHNAPAATEAAMKDRVRHIINGRIDREKLRQRGFVNAERFSWDNAYKQTIDFYREIMNQDPKVGQ